MSLHVRERLYIYTCNSIREFLISKHSRIYACQFKKICTAHMCMRLMAHMCICTPNQPCCGVLYFRTRFRAWRKRHIFSYRCRFLVVHEISGSLDVDLCFFSFVNKDKTRCCAVTTLPRNVVSKFISLHGEKENVEMLGAS